MCLAALSPAAALASGKMSPLAAISPAAAILTKLGRKKKLGVIDERGATQGGY